MKRPIQQRFNHDHEASPGFWTAPTPLVTQKKQDVQIPAKSDVETTTVTAENATNHTELQELRKAKLAARGYPEQWMRGQQEVRQRIMEAKLRFPSVPLGPVSQKEWEDYRASHP